MLFNETIENELPADELETPTEVEASELEELEEVEEVSEEEEAAQADEEEEA